MQSVLCGNAGVRAWRYEYEMDKEEGKREGQDLLDRVLNLSQPTQHPLGGWSTNDQVAVLV